MDNSGASTEPSDLTIDSAAQAMAALLDPPKEEEAPLKVDTEVDPPAEKEPEAESNAAEEGADAPITVEVDGKQVTLTKEQIAEAYKSGLRQSDYTQKTMATAEERKAAEAERTKSQQERASAAQTLQRNAALLEAVLEQTQKTDWEALKQSNPIEFVNQWHLHTQRQAALDQTQRELSALNQKAQAEQAEALKAHLTAQQQELLAKLPEWKDEAKQKSERDALKTYLKTSGFDESDINNINDHRAVILGRKAMLYDQMMAKASAAAKKVANVPTKVERPGVQSERSPLDGRTAAMQRLNKSGKLEDAAAVFASLL